MPDTFVMPAYTFYIYVKIHIFITYNIIYVCIYILPNNPKKKRDNIVACPNIMSES